VWLSNGEGTYAQYCIAKEASAHSLPSKVSFDQGASLWVPYGTAYHSLQHAAQAQPGMTVLIHGASGGVGQACLQFCKKFNVKVMGTASTPEGLSLIQKEGAIPFNHKEDGYTTKIMEASGGKGIDVILEMLANVNLQKDLTMISRGGTIVVIGCRGTVEINPRLMMGARCYITGVQLKLLNPQEHAECIKAITDSLESGLLSPIVGKAYKLEDGPKAHHDIINPPTGALGKIVVHPWD